MSDKLKLDLISELICRFYEMYPTNESAEKSAGRAEAVIDSITAIIEFDGGEA